jgi:hypothetical protein
MVSFHCNTKQIGFNLILASVNTNKSRELPSGLNFTALAGSLLTRPVEAVLLPGDDISGCDTVTLSFAASQYQ